MFKSISSISLLLLVSAAVATAESRTGDPTLQFRRDQTAYIVAFKGDGRPDFTAESEVTKAFEKKKAFRLTNRLQESDFVFVLFGDYTRPREFIHRDLGESGEIMTGAAAMAMTPQDYTLHKGDLEALRGAAVWRELVSSGGWGGMTIVNGRSRLPKKAADKFHKSALKKK